MDTNYHGLGEITFLWICKFVDSHWKKKFQFTDEMLNMIFVVACKLCHIQILCTTSQSMYSDKHLLKSKFRGFI